MTTEGWEREIRGWWLSFQNSYWRKYLDTMEGGIAHIQEEAKTQYQEAESITNPTPDHTSYLEYLAGEHGTHVFRDVPFTFWNSTFVAIFSAFEDEVIEMAQQLNATNNNEILRYGILAKRFRVMEKVLDDLKNHIDQQNGHVDFEEIHHYREIRNLIVHNRGRLCILSPEEQEYLDKNMDEGRKKEIQRDISRSDKIISYISKRCASGEIELKMRNGVIEVTPDFCREALDTTLSFLHKIIALLPEWQHLRQNNG